MSDLKYLSTNFKPSFIRSLVDVGNLVDRLADISSLDRKTRISKWNQETKEHNEKIKNHKVNYESILSYSNFLYKSRQKNEIAYANTQTVSNTDVNFIIHGTLEDIIKKPPSFFATISVESLTINEKRALIHKLEMFENVLPVATRKRIPEMLNEIYQSEYGHNSSRHTSRYPSCCSPFLFSCFIQ
jgi:hypothetical protein